MCSVRWMLPLIVRLKPPHFTSGEPRPPAVFLLKAKKTIHAWCHNRLQAITRAMNSNMTDGGEAGISSALLMLHAHTLTAKHKQSRAAIPNPIVVNMKPASFRRWGEFGPHIPIRPVSKAILHNAAQRTAAEQDFDFPQCDSNFIFLWKATWLLRLASRDEPRRAIHDGEARFGSFACTLSNKCANCVCAASVRSGGAGRGVRAHSGAVVHPTDHLRRPFFYWGPRRPWAASLTACIWSVIVSRFPHPPHTSANEILASGIRNQGHNWEFAACGLHAG